MNIYQYLDQLYDFCMIDVKLIAIAIWKIKDIIWNIMRLVIYQILRLISQSLLTIYNLIQWTHITSVIIAIIDIKNPFNVMKDILNHFSAKSSKKGFETDLNNGLQLHFTVKWFDDKL